MEQPAIAIESELELGDFVDVRAPGGTVTSALCGHWEHDGPCRWPHNSQLNTSTVPAILRTVAAVEPGDFDEVIGLVNIALEEDVRWTVLSCRLAELTSEELALVRRMTRGSGGGGEA